MYDKSDWIKAILGTSVVFLGLLALLLMVDMTVAIDASAKEEAIAGRPSSTYTAEVQPTPEDQNSAQEGERHTASSRFSKKFERGGPLLAELSAVYMRSAVGQPWGRSANEDRMDDLFGKGQSQKLEYENVEPATMARIFSADTNFVFLEGSEDNADEMEDFLDQNMSTIANWVNQGGCLLINAAPREGDGMSYGEFGVTLSRSQSNNGTAADQGHPIFKEPYTPTQTSFDALPLSYAFFSGTDLSPIISDTANQIALGEQKSGLGRVVFGGLTLPWFDFWDPQPEYTNLHKNIIHYAATCFKPVVSGVELAGPPSGGINSEYIFTATIIPTYTRGVITYTWEATGQNGEVDVDAGPTDTATFNWNTEGRKEITVTATTLSGEVFDYHTIDIEIAANPPPEARDVMITPTEVISDRLRVVPTLGTEISVSYTYHDEDSNFEAETRIRWTRDDQTGPQKQPALNDQRTVPSGLTTIPQEQWCVTVEPYDGNSYGEPIEACAYIGTLPDNLLPKADNVEIPTHPSEDEPLVLDYDYSDVEGDSQDQNQTQLRWYRDETLQPAFNDEAKVPAQNTNIGEEWCAKVRVSDGTDFGLTVDSNCGIISPVGNTLPVISNPRIRPDMPKDSDDLSVSYGYIDPDGDSEDETQTIIRWLRDGQLEPEFNNQRSVDAMFTTPGEKWWAVIEPHDGQNYGRFDITPPVYISEDQNNTPPEATNVKINPAEPSDGQDLRLTYEFSDPDEGDVEEGTIIRWYKSNSSSEPQPMEKYDQLTVVPNSDTLPSEVWHAVVIPYDGQDYGPNVAAHSVTILEKNSPPEARDVLLAPAMPGDDDNLELSYEYYDTNDDQQGATEITWTINDQEELAIRFKDLSTVPRRATSVGEKWCATVTPHDGTKPGEAVESNCVTIAKQNQNTPPTISEVYIDPPVPRTSDELNLKYTYRDQDNHPEANTTIHWYRNSKPFKSDYEDQTVIPASQTSPGDKWSAVVQVFDRNGESGVVTSTEFVIINTAPQVVSAAIVPQEPVTTQDLTVSYQYSDKDNHPASDPRIILWFKNGAHQKEYDGQKRVPAQATSIGDKWVVQLRPFDGYEDGSKFIADQTNIGARLYLPIILRQMPSPPDEATPIPGATNTPTATPSPTNTPTATPSPTPTPAPFEPNNTSEDAYGPLQFGQVYPAYPEDQDDWYYIILNQTTSLEVIVNNYAPSRDGAGGQVIVYELFFNAQTQTMDRRVIASDGRELPNMKIPNELKPNALEELPPGKYLIRIYTVANYSRDELYQLQSNKR